MPCILIISFPSLEVAGNAYGIIRIMALLLLTGQLFRTLDTAYIAFILLLLFYSVFLN